jgi:hypothetical protein
VPSHPESKYARGDWATAAENHLAEVVRAVRPLRRAFEASDEIEAETALGLASPVVEACGRLTAWLSSSRAPRGRSRAEGELAAAAGVYRNAAFAFRSLPEAEAEQLEARSIACATMLQQGQAHVEAFLAAVEGKSELAS